MKRSCIFPSIVATLLGLGWASASIAQESRKDDALDNLLKKLEAAPGREAQPEPKPKPADPVAPKSGEAKEEAPAERSRPGSKTGAVAPKDQALDDLLEKLGQTPDAPTPEKRPAGPGGAPRPPGGPPPEKPSQGGLKGQEKDLDEHLEELLGRKKKKSQDDQGGEGGGPLAQIVKEMREVEKRLSQPDTGDETRKKEEHIVKNIQELIEQLRAAQSQSKMRMRQVRQAGQKPGGEQGGPGAQGTAGGGVGPMKPAKPPVKSILAGGKDEWGHLPPELRGEMSNVFKEEPLPERVELIRRYYLSLSKKAKAREE